ncbi:MAG: T9SS type A sorting domain-containing protein [Bacteroidia bacterium]
MKLSLLLPCAFFFCCSLGYAQYVERPTDFSSSGSYGYNTTNQLQSNIGELMITTFSSSAGMLTQGYIQPEPGVITVAGNIGTGQALVYPNPFTDQFFVDLPSAADQPSIEVYDVTGRLCSASLESVTISGRLRYSLRLAESAGGIYFVRIHSAQINATIKIIKLG